MATYAGVCLWNFKPIFPDEPVDTLDNVATLVTFTGSLDESWFYLVSVAIEARGAPVISEMLAAIADHRDRHLDSVVHQHLGHEAGNRGDEVERAVEPRHPAGGQARFLPAPIAEQARRRVHATHARRVEIAQHDVRPLHVFYHRIRPFLAGSKNMADAGLPNGVIYEDGTGKDVYRQFSGGSNAQSSLIQFFDIVLGVEHRPTGEKRVESSESEEGTAPPAKHNFIQVGKITYCFSTPTDSVAGHALIHARSSSPVPRARDDGGQYPRLRGVAPDEP